MNGEGIEGGCMCVLELFCFVLRVLWLNISQVGCDVISLYLCPC